MSAFHDQLQQQLAQVKQLNTLLEQEKSVITKGNAEQLMAITEQKKQLLTSITSLDNVLAQVFANGEEQIDTTEQELIAEIEQTLTRCKELNTINGQVINHSQQAIDRLKSNLFDHRRKATMTYDAKGKTHSGSSGLGIKA